MAEVFRTIKGRPVEEYLVELPGTARAMRSYAFELEAHAEVVLEAARDFSLMIGRPFEENAKITSERESGNRWNVWLDDTGNERQGAASSIEFGRLPGMQEGTGAMAGLEILGQAVQILKDRHRRSLR